MRDGLKNLSRAATVYVWMQIAWQVVGIGLIGVTVLMLIGLYRAMIMLIGG